MTDIGRNETLLLGDDDHRSGTFEGHSAFARMSRHYIDDEVPLTHHKSHDQRVETMPIQFDRTNQDSVDRTQDDLMIQLAAAVDQRCMQTLLDTALIPIEDLSPDCLDSWIARSAMQIRLASRSACGIDVAYDTELDFFVTESWDRDDSFVDLGWQHLDAYGMSRHQTMSDGLYILIAQQHIVPLSSRVSLFLRSHAMDLDNEYLSGLCELSYQPRLDFHPGAIRIGRVVFADEAQWRSTVQAHLR